MMDTQTPDPNAVPPGYPTEAAMQFAMDAINRMPKTDSQTIEAHITAVLVVFWGALWGTCGTEFARGYIEAQLRGMEPDVPHEVYTAPTVQ